MGKEMRLGRESKRWYDCLPDFDDIRVKAMGEACGVGIVVHKLQCGQVQRDSRRPMRRQGLSKSIIDGGGGLYTRGRHRRGRAGGWRLVPDTFNTPLEAILTGRGFFVALKVVVMIVRAKSVNEFNIPSLYESDMSCNQSSFFYELALRA